MQLIRLFAWFPYRVLGFFGVVHENTVTPQVVQGNSTSLVHFLGSAVSNQTYFAVVIGVAACIVYFFIRKKGNTSRFVKLSFIIGLIGIFIHGNPPEHYYLPLIPLLFMMIGDTIAILTKPVITIIFVSIIFLNTSYYFGNDDRMTRGLVPYETQTKIIDNILKDANGHPFWIKRQGPFDQFTDNYAQNYLYLAWYKGQKPVRDSELVFTIHDDGQNSWYEKN